MFFFIVLAPCVISSIITLHTSVQNNCYVPFQFSPFFFRIHNHMTHFSHLNDLLCIFSSFIPGIVLLCQQSHCRYSVYLHCLLQSQPRLHHPCCPALADSGCMKDFGSVYLNGSLACSTVFVTFWRNHLLSNIGTGISNNSYVNVSPFYFSICDSAIHCIVE